MPPIPFRELPDFSALFCDYVDGAPAVMPFFNGDPRNADELLAQAARVRERMYPREALADALLAQNTALGAGSKTFQNIERLRQPGSVAIVTGQQVGLFGGPLYSLYKTLTTLKLCEELSARHPEIVWAPVFWLEVEDHDYAESNHATVPDAAGVPVTVTYTPLADVADGMQNRGPVGALAFDAGLDAVIEALDASLPHTDFHADVMAMLRDCYSPGVTFGDAFGRLMHRLLPDAGLITINTLDPAIKRLLAPVFRRELETWPRVSESIIEATAQLEETYHAQVKARTINLFMLWKNGRYGIEPRRDHNDFWLKGTRQYFTREELLAMLDAEPERFSPNVVLRPICQDALFPTAAYVGGPGEIAYFAQFKGVYEAFDMPMPIIYPRASVTLLEQKFSAQLDRLGVGLAEFLADPRAALQKAAQAQANVDLDAVFAAARAILNSAFEGLRPSLDRVDKTLGGALSAANEKAAQALDQLGKKSADAAVRASDTLHRQSDKLQASVYPNGTLQERVVSIFYFLNKYGFDVMRLLAESITSDTFAHHVVVVEGGPRKPLPEPTLFG